MEEDNSRLISLDHDNRRKRVLANTNAKKYVNLYNGNICQGDNRKTCATVAVASACET
jgi:hypothetical protein